MVLLTQALKVASTIDYLILIISQHLNITRAVVCGAYFLSTACVCKPATLLHNQAELHAVRPL